MPIDYSKYSDDGLTEEQLSQAETDSAARRMGFKPKVWYRFRSITMTGKKVSKPVDKAGNPIPTAKGNRYIMETVRAVRPDGSLSTKTKEIRNIIVLVAKTPPDLLLEEGYTPDQVAYIGNLGLPDVLDNTLGRLRCFDVEGLKQSEPAHMNNMRKLQMQLWLENQSLAGSEFFAQVYYSTKNGYTNANLQYFRPEPPKNDDGTEATYADPDAK